MESFCDAIARLMPDPYSPVTASQNANSVTRLKCFISFLNDYQGLAVILFDGYLQTRLLGRLLLNS
jgi:hypothetical protein